MRFKFLVILALIGIASPVWAQPPGRGGDESEDRGRGGWDRGRGGWDRGRGGWDRGGEGGDRGDWFSRMDPSAMLRRADRNGDGRVEPDEIDERFRGFTNRVLERYGFDPNKPVELEALSKKYQEQRDGGSDDGEGDEDVSTTFGIPGFEDAEESLPPLVPDFYLQPDSPLLMTGSLDARYDRSILDQVDRTLRLYDRNRDGVLNNEEIRRGRFSNPPVDESDLDKDGRLSKVELAERYVARAGGRGRLENGRSSRGSSSRDSRDRFRRGGDNDDNRDDRDSSRSSNRSSSDRSSSSSRSSSGSSSSSRNDKITSYAQSILDKYDENDDGVLDKKEAESIRSLPRGADKDENGEITLDELIVGFGGSASGSSRQRNSSNNPYSVMTGSDRSSEADRDFQKLDVNTDGLIQMHEFTDQWTEELAENFAQLDSNNDGVVTVSEWSSGGGLRSSRSSSRYRSRSDR